MSDLNDRLSKILSEKDSPKLNESFDDNLMLLIHKKAFEKAEKRNEIKLIYVFFIVGIVLGIVVSFYLQDIRIYLVDYSLTIKKQFLLIPLMIGLLFVFDKMYKIDQYQKGNKKVIM